MEEILNILEKLYQMTAFSNIIADPSFLIMYALAFILLYLVTTENFGTPLFAPFSPIVGRDLRDSVLKYNLGSLDKRPRTLKSPNKRRLK